MTGVAPRHSGDLHKPQLADLFADRLGQMPFQHLHVIEIQMQLQVRAVDLAQDARGVIGMIQKVTVHALGRITRAIGNQAHFLVDGFNDANDAVSPQHRRRMAQVREISSFCNLVVGARANRTRHDMHRGTLQRACILDHRGKAIAKLLLASGHRGNSAITARPIAHGRIEQHHFEPVITRPHRQLRRRIVIRHLKLNSFETGSSRRFKTIEKRQLGKLSNAN